MCKYRDGFSTLRIFFTFLVLTIGVFVSIEAQGTTAISESIQNNCSSAIPLDCVSGPMTVAYSQASAVIIPAASCFSNVNSAYLHSLWFSFSASGANGYYLNAINSNVGINIYSGSCSNLELYECIESFNQSGSYWSNDLLPEGDYFIQVLSEVIEEDSETDIFFGCFEDYTGNCNVSIEFVNLSECLNESGIVDVVVGGNTSEEYVSLELSVDGNLYFFDCVVYNGFWISNFQLQGESIAYASAYAGNSETGCSSDITEEIILPTINCNGSEDNLLKFLDGASEFCSPTTATIKMYQVGTSVLKHVFTVSFNSATQSYLLQDPPTGNYDVYIKPAGSLQQGFEAVQINTGTHTFTLGAIQKGDLNNNNSINISDASMIAGAFNAVIGSSNYNSTADFNCNGSINISDISIFGLSFNQVGEGPVTAP